MITQQSNAESLVLPTNNITGLLVSALLVPVTLYTILQHRHAKVVLQVAKLASITRQLQELNVEHVILGRFLTQL